MQRNDVDGQTLQFRLHEVDRIKKAIHNFLKYCIDTLNTENRKVTTDIKLAAMQHLKELNAAVIESKKSTEFGYAKTVNNTPTHQETDGARLAITGYFTLGNGANWHVAQELITFIEECAQAAADINLSRIYNVFLEQLKIIYLKQEFTAKKLSTSSDSPHLLTAQQAQKPLTPHPPTEPRRIMTTVIPSADLSEAEIKSPSNISIPPADSNQATVAHLVTFGAPVNKARKGDVYTPPLSPSKTTPLAQRERALSDSNISKTPSYMQHTKVSEQKVTEKKKTHEKQQEKAASLVTPIRKASRSLTPTFSTQVAIAKGTTLPEDEVKNLQQGPGFRRK